MKKDDLLLHSLETFYSDPQHMRTLQDLLSKTPGMPSLRNLDRFTSKVSKARPITTTTRSGKTINVHICYKASLEGYTKKLFDPFCRRDRIDFNGITTTLGQLNYLRWCIQYGIIEYLLSEKKSRESTLDAQNVPGVRPDPEFHEAPIA